MGPLTSGWDVTQGGRRSRAPAGRARQARLRGAAYDVGRRAAAAAHGGALCSSAADTSRSSRSRSGPRSRVGMDGPAGRTRAVRCGTFTRSVLWFARFVSPVVLVASGFSVIWAADPAVPAEGQAALADVPSSRRRGRGEVPGSWRWWSGATAPLPRGVRQAGCGAERRDAEGPIFRIASMTKPMTSTGGDDAGRGREDRRGRPGRRNTCRGSACRRC